MKNSSGSKELPEQKYVSTDGLFEKYSISKSMQAKLRMNKEIPYVRPAGSRLVLYAVADIDAWLKEWKVS